MKRLAAIFVLICIAMLPLSAAQIVQFPRTNVVAPGDMLLMDVNVGGSYLTRSIAASNLWTGGSNMVHGPDKRVQFNDGGLFGSDPGFEYVKASDQLSVPNLRISLTGAVNYLVVSNWVTSPYGAIPDDAVDDYAAITNAIYVAKAKKQAVLFDKGTYLVSKKIELSDGAILLGGGSSNTVIKLLDSAPITNLTGKFFVIQQSGTNANDVRIDGIHIDANSTGQTNRAVPYGCIHIQGAGTIVENNSFSGYQMGTNGDECFAVALLSSGADETSRRPGAIVRGNVFHPPPDSYVGQTVPYVITALAVGAQNAATWTYGVFIENNTFLPEWNITTNQINRFHGITLAQVNGGVIRGNVFSRFYGTCYYQDTWAIKNVSIAGNVFDTVKYGVGINLGLPAGYTGSATASNLWIRNNWIKLAGDEMAWSSVQPWSDCQRGIQLLGSAILNTFITDNIITVPNSYFHDGTNCLNNYGIQAAQSGTALPMTNAITIARNVLGPQLFPIDFANSSEVGSDVTLYDNRSFTGTTVHGKWGPASEHWFDGGTVSGLTLNAAATNYSGYIRLSENRVLRWRLTAGTGAEFGSHDLIIERYNEAGDTLVDSPFWLDFESGLLTLFDLRTRTNWMDEIILAHNLTVAGTVTGPTLRLASGSAIYSGVLQFLEETNLLRWRMTAGTGLEANASDFTIERYNADGDTLVDRPFWIDFETGRVVVYDQQIRTNYVDEIIATNGVSLGGVRKTVWPDYSASVSNLNTLTYGYPLVGGGAAGIIATNEFAMEHQYVGDLVVTNSISSSNLLSGHVVLTNYATIGGTNVTGKLDSLDTLKAPLASPGFTGIASAPVLQGGQYVITNGAGLSLSFSANPTGTTNINIVYPDAPTNGILQYSLTAGTNMVGTVLPPTSGQAPVGNGTAFTLVTVAKTMDVQTFTTPGANTWTKPAGAVAVQVLAIGGGGGGGSGRKGAAGTARVGGGGGGGGGYSMFTLPAALLGGTETVTVGAGGTGGAAQATDSTSGVNGTNGTRTYFGNWGVAYYGSGGDGGGDGAGGTGGVGYASYNENAGSVGGTASAVGAAGVTPTSQGVWLSAAGGAAGAGLTTANATSAGAAGGTGSRGINVGSGVAGGTAGTVGNPGGNGTSVTAELSCGGGGGGSGGSAGGAGGNGGLYGAGGGGGAAGIDATTNSGAGGNGASGICIVYTWF